MVTIARGSAWPMLSLMVATGVLRVFVVYDSMRQLSGLWPGWSSMSLELIGAPLLQHLPLAGLFMACGVGVAGHDGWVRWLPFWLGLVGMATVDGNLWAPWGALASGPLTAAGLLYGLRRRGAPPSLLASSAGVLAVVVAPAVAMQLELFECTADATLVGSLVVLCGLVGARSSRGWIVLGSSSLLVFVAAVLDCVVFKEPFGSSSMWHFNLSFRGLTLLHPVMIAAGAIGVRSAWLSAQRADAAEYVRIAPSLVAAVIAVCVPSFYLWPLFHPNHGWLEQIEARSDGTADISWSRAEWLTFRLGRGIGYEQSANPFSLTGEEFEADTGRYVTWHIGLEGVLERRYAPPPVDSAAAAARYVSSDIQFDTDEVIIGGRRIPLPGRLDDIPDSRFHDWPRFVPLIVESEQGRQVVRVDLAMERLLPGPAIAGATALITCDKQWCILRAPRALVTVAAESGRPLSRIDLPTYGPVKLATENGVLWFSCGRGYVCAVSIDAPSTIVGGEHVPAISATDL